MATGFTQLHVRQERLAITNAAAAEDVSEVKVVQPEVSTTVREFQRGMRMMTVTIPQNLVKKARSEEFKQLAAKTDIPGFRKGTPVRTVCVIAFSARSAP